MSFDLGSPFALDVVLPDGRPLDLADYRGRANVFVYFMRALSCAQCNAAVRALAAQREEFERQGVQVIVAVPEEADAAAAWQQKKGVPFPVVVGRSGTPHAEAGMLRKVFGAVQQSGGVLIDAAGGIRYRHVSTNPGASYRRDELQRAIEALPPLA